MEDLAGKCCQGQMLELIWPSRQRRRKQSFITSTPGVDVIKLFTAVSCSFSYLARVFVRGWHFRPSLMFVGKANSLP
jgi:hypothetical protein